MSQLTSNLQANYDLFLDEVRESRVIWALQSGEDWIVCDSNEYEDTDVLPVWSSEAYAKIHCVEEWAEYKAVSIDLETFFEEWVNDLSNDDVMIGINWNEDLDGVEVEPMDLAKALAEA